MFYGQSTCEGLYQGETKCIPTTSRPTNSDSLLNTHSTVEDRRTLGKMKSNEPGRQTDTGEDGMLQTAARDDRTEMRELFQVRGFIFCLNC